MIESGGGREGRRGGTQIPRPSSLEDPLVLIYMVRKIMFPLGYIRIHVGLPICTKKSLQIFKLQPGLYMSQVNKLSPHEIIPRNERNLINTKVQWQVQ